MKDRPTVITATLTAGWGSAPTLNDNPLVVNETSIQARHITELRDAINALHSHKGFPAYSWQYAATTNDWISANPILEMRTALDEALGPASGGYSTGLAQFQQIKAIHVQELRDRVLAAWTSGSSTQINWLVADHLGTPRMIFDQTGSLANTKRHDYLPFGEELFGGSPNQPGVGGRLTTQGYIADNLRQKFTLKERDNETGLDYFGAGYHSSVQGRFTGVDIAGPDLINPQSLNKYAYTLNNPLRYIDRKGLYEEDVHLQLTYALGMAAGFTARDAWNIALGDQGVDDDPNRSPMTVFGVEARRNYHFTTPARRDELWGDFVSASGAYTGPNNNNESALDSLGTFLHAQQDSYSHEGFGPNLGHVWPPWNATAADKTYNDPAKADRMAFDTYNRLTTAATVLYNNHKISFQYKPLEWKVISPLVEAFNRARTPEEKQKALNQIKILAQQNLQRQAQEAIRKKEEAEKKKRRR